MTKRPLATIFLGLLVAAGGCADDKREDALNEDLLNPEKCKQCHPVHFEQWQSSMHAYASEDPVFRAMNEKGQRETDGALGDFCINCHAPLAVQLGLTDDGLNLDEVPLHLQGVTCYFCHNVESVDGTHNNPLTLAMDNVMRGSIWTQDPVENTFHESTYSRLMDQRTHESAAMCGSCHDIVSPAGAHIERTFLEWEESLFADVLPGSGDPAPYANQCGTCHAYGVDGPIAEFEGVSGDRKLHSHLAEGVDLAITDFPNAAEAPALKQMQLDKIAANRTSVVCSSLCVQDKGDGTSEINVWLHNEGAGHSWPSGANADRRAWLELKAYGADSKETIFSSGVVDDQSSIDELDDPNLWAFRDYLYDADGMETHDFWEAVSFEGNALGVAEGLGSDFEAALWMNRSYTVDGVPESVTSVLKIRAIGFEILDDLIESGDLDPKHRDAFVTSEIASTSLQWPHEDQFDVEGFGSCISISPTCQAPVLLP